MASHPPSLLVQPSRPTTALDGGHSRSLGPAPAPPPPLPAPCTTPPRHRGPIPNLLPIFTASSPIRGTVKITVEDTVFLAHKEILALGSPFFEALLLGDWKETAKKQRRPPSELEVVQEEHGEDDDTPSSKRESYRTAGTSISVTSIDETEEDLLQTPRPSEEQSSRPFGVEEEGVSASEAGDVAPSMTASYLSSLLDDEWDEDDEDDGDETIVCSLRLREEQASSFQDFLCHLYPRLELLVTWQNAGELLRLSSKFDVPSLRSACIAFLLPSAAGNPLKGMKIAEDNHIPELFKEASRYTLDNFQNWLAEELATLSEPTLLKLERRRSWFLERLLKLGLVQVSRDYTCVPSCPDPTHCAKLVNDKWTSAWSSAFRFNNTPQPSIAYRSLRQLEPSLQSPALHLPMTACQDNARLFIADLFDRMFSLSITPSRGWGALTLNGTMSGSGGYGRTFGPGADIGTKSSARYFLFIEMHEPAPKKERTERMAGGLSSSA